MFPAFVRDAASLRWSLSRILPPVAALAAALLAAFPIAAAPLLSSPYSIGTGSQPQNVISADLNEDGKADLVEANYASNTVSIYLGNGDGTFQQRHDYQTDNGPDAVTVVDLDRFGGPDVIVACPGSNSVCVFRGNGDGTLQSPVSVPTDLVPTEICFGYRGIEPLVFVSCRNSAVIDEIEYALFTFRVVDHLPLSGSPAYVTAVREGDALYVLASIPPNNTIQQYVVSSGAFGQPDLHTGSSPAGLAAGMLFDGAFLPDIVVANSGDSTVSVFDTDHHDARLDVPAGRHPVAVCLADVDGDGRLDIVVTHNETGDVSVILNHGDRTFSIPMDFTPAANTNWVAAGDLDGDGLADLVTSHPAENRISECLSLGHGSFPGYESLRANPNPQSVVVGDVNHDGRLDLAVVNPANNTVSVFLANGIGTYAAGVDYPVPGYPFALALGDVDGDGKLDLVVSQNAGGIFSLAVLPGNGDGTFRPYNQYTDFFGPSSLALADLDGDGSLDVVTTHPGFPSVVAVSLNPGNGAFGNYVTYSAGTRPVSVAVSDVNGDGRPDLVVADAGDNAVGILEQPFGSNWVQYPVGLSPSCVAITDLERDGHPDIVVTCQGSNTMVSLHGHADGTFSSWAPIATGHAPTGVVMTDVNGDGYPDAIVTNAGDNTCGVHLNDTAGGLRPTSSFYYAGIGPSGIATGDLNGDSRPDVAIADAGSEAANPVLVLFGINPLPAASVPPAGRPNGLSMVEAFPNPAAGPVTFRLNLPTAGPVRLNVYDSTGRLRRTLWDQPLNAGPHVLSWGALDDQRAHLPAGVYFYELRSGGARVARPLTILR